eukprot:CAMPEP_0194087022 /NCGR_PEP_ID=MMETSP0149-20130528/23531_1 /TAXON_ID=122233 /ORGANISM="Chaetoceros debilis, Strain MM31A-1" /LENGTH=1004 /DNA_ID=CAMNT_0038770269 /DNA_START=33 /DNA_END=3047 /DNA_ORIENTATION=-
MRVLRLHQLQRQLVRRVNVTRPSAVTLNNTIATSARTISVLGGNVRFQSSGRALSSFAEPEQTLFHDSRPKMTEDYSELDKQLRSDVKTMGSILGATIEHFSGKEIFDKVEKLRLSAKAWRDAGAGRDESQSAACDASFDSMHKTAQSLSNEELMTVSRAFSHFCAIANAAEYHHRVRRNERKLHDYAENEGKDSCAALMGSASDSCGGVIPQLFEQDGLSAQEIYDTLTTQQVEIVLTAHPTEVNRRTLLDKHRRIQNLLTKADELRQKGTPTKFQQKTLDDALKREIWLIWQSDELSRRKPSVQEESERGTLVVEAVLWETLPNFLRKLDATMVDTLGEEHSLPLDAAPFKFSSWMGGDRDGNPNVTPNVTREVTLRNRIRAATLLKCDLGEIAGRLSTTFCNDELRKKVGDEARAPYRAYLAPIMAKLQLTIDWAEQDLEKVKNGHVMQGQKIDSKDVYLSKQELMDEILLIYRSLGETGNQLTADGKVLDLLRNLSGFGLTLVPLDVRQESTRHTEALDAITRHLGVGSYSEWDEATKINWLQAELASKRPLIHRSAWADNADFSDTVKDTLETFEMISEQHDDSLNAYVISQATTPSDVLAVLLLQIDAGVKNPLRVVPLFETLDDLNGASETMETLFNLPVYRGSINGKQEVMIGYSDSAKDAGRLSASWAQYETQEALAAVATKNNIDLVFFHGKGGTVGRGGNPATFKAILAHAPDTINGKFRVTEQGEMIYQNFGHPDRAERTLDIYTAAVCAEKHTERPTPSPEWRGLMNKLSDISCNAYRQIVTEDERFVPYFRSATPEQELSDLNIGSRPAKRKASGGVESLRAIPWIFAWTQTRLNLPTWLGVGEAISEVLKTEDADELRKMYNEWGSFRTTIDLVEMVLAKSEPSIARHYDNVLVTDEKAKELGADIRKQHKDTESAVLDLAGHNTFCESNELLQRILNVRNPYVDCMNVMQVEILKRLRECDNEEEEALLKDALLVSITGIANGMGNTG